MASALNIAIHDILIIEDSPTARLYLRKVIEFAFPGSRVTEAEDGRTALQTLTRTTTQLIISDLNMPRMDGRVFLQTLRKNRVLAKKPVLMLSSEPAEALADLVKDDTLLRFLPKPSDPETIAAAVKDLLAAAAKL